MDGPVQARFYFKMVAQQVHPDKNRHPLANEVFQKIKAALEYCSVNRPKGKGFQSTEKKWDNI